MSQVIEEIVDDEIGTSEMQVNTIKFRIVGIVPLLMHNGRLADPMSDVAIAMKAITSKKDKTNDDREKLAELEWRGGLYHDGKAPIIPSTNIEAMIRKAASSKRKGKLIQAAAWCDDEPQLIYDGPKSVDAMWKSGKFIDQRGVVNPSTRSRVIRTRPIFRQWSLEFSIVHYPDMINACDLIDFVRYAGRFIGMCEYVPRYGRFQVVEPKEEAK